MVLPEPIIRLRKRWRSSRRNYRLLRNLLLLLMSTLLLNRVRHRQPASLMEVQLVPWCPPCGGTGNAILRSYIKRSSIACSVQVEELIHALDAAWKQMIAVTTKHDEAIQNTEKMQQEGQNLLAE